MDNQKLNWIISIIREDIGGGVPPTNNIGNGDGQVKLFSPVVTFRRRKGPQIKLPPGSRKRWTKNK